MLTSCLLSVVAVGYRTDDVRPVENPVTDEHEQLHERVGSLIANVWCVALLAGAVSLAGTTSKEAT